MTKPKDTGIAKVSTTRTRGETGTSKVTNRGRICKGRQSSTHTMKQTVSGRSRCTKLPLSLDTDRESSSDRDCAICGLPYGLDVKLWIQCDECKLWMQTSCVDIESDIQRFYAVLQPLPTETVGSLLPRIQLRVIE